MSHNVTNGLKWPNRPAIKISLNSFNGFLRSNLPCGIRSNQQPNAGSTSRADKIRSQNLHNRPRYARFLHNRPGYAVLAPPFLSLNAPVYRPRYAVFGGHFNPLATPASVDPKTSEVVHYLFSFRGRRLGEKYLNRRLIPWLCEKAGVPLRDARGNITSHRARSTIASMLYNAKEPLTLFELQAWLGHHSPNSTQYYAKQSPTKVAKSYEKAGYFGRNIRMVEVLIDQEAIKSGEASNGLPWRFYDLGHGYCLYEFFEQCPHRMACAHCAFYRPKGSTQAQLLEGKANLLHMLQAIPLSEEERAAVEDGITSMEKLCQQLADVPTPAGPTPNQLALENESRQTVIPVERIQRRKQSK